MPRYRYTATDAAGNRSTGELDAESAAAATGELQAKGLSVETLQLQSESSGSQRRLTDQQVTDLAHQVAGTTRGGLPLAGGLRALAEETTSGPLRFVLWTLADQLDAGLSLEDAMRSHGDRLPAHMRALVFAGVRTGKLGQVLEQHVKYFNMVSELRRKLWASLAYPALLIGALSSLMFLVSVFVVSGFKRIFMDFGVELPWITLVMVRVSEFVTSGWWLVPLLLAVLFVGWVSLGGIWNAAARRRLAYRIPFVGPVLRWSALARFCHLLGLLVESELPLPAALQLAGDGSRDPEIADACRSVTLSTEAGLSLSNSLTSRRRFPAELAQIIGWGEGVQTLPEAMYMAGEMFEGRARLHTTFVITAASPVTFVFLIFGVGLTVIALFAPLFKLMSELSG